MRRTKKWRHNRAVQDATKAKRKREVKRIRNRQGRLVPTAYDVNAPVLHRRVPGLKKPRTRTVRINGFPLTLVETP